MLDDKDVDAVVIATPNHWHALAAIWALQADKHVFVEKPVSHNVSEGRRMVEALAATIGSARPARKSAASKAASTPSSTSNPAPWAVCRSLAACATSSVPASVGFRASSPFPIRSITTFGAAQRRADP